MKNFDVMTRLPNSNEINLMKSMQHDLRVLLDSCLLQEIKNSSSLQDTA